MVIEIYCVFGICLDVVYYTFIDFNGVDMRIYLPEKVVFTEAERLR